MPESSPIEVGDCFQLGWSWVQVHAIEGDRARVGPILNRAYPSATMPPEGWVPLSDIPGLRIAGVKE